MAVRTSTQAGNWSAAATWGGAAPPGANDQAIINHAVIGDVDITVGLALAVSSWNLEPTLLATGSGGSLPAGAYRVRLSAAAGGVETTPPQHASVTITAGQLIRVTLPALPFGASGWNIYLSQAGGGADTERRYATNKPAGTFDCSSANWEDATVAYGSAAGLPNSDAVRVLAGSLTQNANTTFVVNGDFRVGNAGFVQTGPCTLRFGNAAQYKWYSGNAVSQANTLWTINGTTANRVVVETAAGGQQAALVPGKVSFDEGQTRVTWTGAIFRRFGIAGGYAADLYCTSGHQQAMTDVVFESTSASVRFRGATTNDTTAPRWLLTRVSFEQAEANCVVIAARKYSVEFTQPRSLASNLRTATSCVWLVPPRVAGNGALYDLCYFDDVPDPAGSGILLAYGKFRDSFIRKRSPVAGSNAIDTANLNCDLERVYLLLDVLSDTAANPVDFNPHGFGFQQILSGVNMTLDGLVAEYAGRNTGVAVNSGGTPGAASDTGDILKSPPATNYAAAPTVFVRRMLVVPTSVDQLYTGNTFTVPTYTLNANCGFDFEHCTMQTGPFGAIVTAEQGLTTRPQIIKSIRSNLGYAWRTTSGNNRYLTDNQAAANPANDDIIDAALAAVISHNAYVNLQVSSQADCFGPYNHRMTNPNTAGASDINLGTSNDLAASGPKLVDPTRNFLTWCDSLGGSGTFKQRLDAGLDKLRALANTTSPNYSAAVTAATARTWVTDGWKVREASLNNSGHDGVTRGALAFVAGGPDLVSIAPATIVNDANRTIVLTGTGFTGATAVTIVLGVVGTVLGFVVNSDSQITATVLAGQAAGVYDVQVNVGGPTDLLAAALTVNDPVVGTPTTNSSWRPAAGVADGVAERVAE